MSNINETKLKFFGIIKTAVEQNAELDYDVTAELLETSKANLKRWFKEFKEEAKTDTILKAVNLDDIMFDKVVEQVELVETEAEELTNVQINPVTGVLEVVEATEAPSKVTQVKKFREGLTGLKILQEETQAAAGQLVCQIAEAAAEDELSARDLATLSNALTSIQNAFFNKPTTNVQVNTVQANTDEEGVTSLLSALKGNLKP